MQRVFTRRANKRYGLRMCDYYIRCRLLGLESLEHRRAKSDVILCYKILNCHVNISPDVFFKLSEFRGRGHSMKLQPDFPLNPRNCMLQFFSHRVVNIWNSLDDNAIKLNVTKFCETVRSMNFSHNLRV